MGKGWDIEAAEGIGKAIPNEFSKLSPYLRYIPYIGWILQALGAIDAGTTAYADTYEKNVEAGFPKSQARTRGLFNAMESGGSAGMGGYQNPGQYGSGGNIDKNWADYAGQVGSIYNMRNASNYNQGKNLFSMYDQNYAGNDRALQGRPTDMFWATPYGGGEAIAPVKGGKMEGLGAVQGPSAEQRADMVNNMPAMMLAYQRQQQAQQINQPGTWNRSPFA